MEDLSATIVSSRFQEAAMGAHIFILASDSYKGSATSQEVESSIAEGIRSLLPDATI